MPEEGRLEELPEGSRISRRVVDRLVPARFFHGRDHQFERLLSREVQACPEGEEIPLPEAGEDACLEEGGLAETRLAEEYDQLRSADLVDQAVGLVVAAEKQALLDGIIQEGAGTRVSVMKSCGRGLDLGFGRFGASAHSTVSACDSRGLWLRLCQSSRIESASARTPSSVVRFVE